MKFFRAPGLPATTWNPVTDRAMYNFTDGVFETEDPDLIKFMQDAGYPSDAPESKNQVVPETVLPEVDHIADASKMVEAPVDRPETYRKAKKGKK